MHRSIGRIHTYLMVVQFQRSLVFCSHWMIFSPIQTILEVYKCCRVSFWKSKIIAANKVNVTSLNIFCSFQLLRFWVMPLLIEKYMLLSSLITKHWTRDSTWIGNIYLLTRAFARSSRVHHPMISNRAFENTSAFFGTEQHRKTVCVFWWQSAARKFWSLQRPESQSGFDRLYARVLHHSRAWRNCQKNQWDSCRTRTHPRTGAFGLYFYFRRHQLSEKDSGSSQKDRKWCDRAGERQPKDPIWWLPKHGSYVSIFAL